VQIAFITMASDSGPFDIIIIGAGISGINAAYRLQTLLPHHRFTILEARDCIGGTWSFWKYPGVRSDSAMAVFGFAWAPWPYSINMVDAQHIASYIQNAAELQGIDQKIRLGHRVTESSWSSEEQKWTLSVDIATIDGIQKKKLKTSWVISCGGYYDYANPLPAIIPGIKNFQGQVVHPQFWSDDVDYVGKKIVIIGSGATAVTLLPALAKTARSVTILQRSPSYITSRPTKEHLLEFLRKWLPVTWALTLTWWKNIIAETLFVIVTTSFPAFGRTIITKGTKKMLPPDFDIDKHFNPRYNVFDQRLCFCPDGDFFKALHKPSCTIITDTIETVTGTGILTKSGQTIDADMIITATGLLMTFATNTPLIVDGVPIHESVHQRYIWNSTMLEGVPNSGFITGYTAGTWTPGADARTRMQIKVIKYMERNGATAATPFIEPEERKTMPVKPVLTNSSTYIIKARERLPIAADIGPWRIGKRWAEDVFWLLFGNVAHGMIYTVPSKPKGD
jgi:cation diffusion facilitator CzcD-associated flavoprotein CzcO